MWVFSCVAVEGIVHEQGYLKPFDSDNETLINLWHTEPALWASFQLINSNADARKAALSRISKEVIEGHIDTSMWSC